MERMEAERYIEGGGRGQEVVNSHKFLFLHRIAIRAVYNLGESGDSNELLVASVKMQQEISKPKSTSSDDASRPPSPPIRSLSTHSLLTSPPPPMTSFIVHAPPTHLPPSLPSLAPPLPPFIPLSLSPSLPPSLPHSLSPTHFPSLPPSLPRSLPLPPSLCPSLPALSEKQSLHPPYASSLATSTTAAAPDQTPAMPEGENSKLHHKEAVSSVDCDSTLLCGPQEEEDRECDSSFRYCLTLPSTASSHLVPFLGNPFPCIGTPIEWELGEQSVGIKPQERAIISLPSHASDLHCNRLQHQRQELISAAVCVMSLAAPPVSEVSSNPKSIPEQPQQERHTPTFLRVEMDRKQDQLPLCASELSAANDRPFSAFIKPVPSTSTSNVTMVPSRNRGSRMAAKFLLPTTSSISGQGEESGQGRVIFKSGVSHLSLVKCEESKHPNYVSPSLDLVPVSMAKCITAGNPSTGGVIVDSAVSARALNPSGPLHRSTHSSNRGECTQSDSPSQTLLKIRHTGMPSYALLLPTPTGSICSLPCQPGHPTTATINTGTIL